MPNTNHIAVRAPPLPPNNSNSTFTTATTVTTSVGEIVKSDVAGTDSIYKVELNFDTNIRNMDADVLSKYINRVLGNHPYYIDVRNIIDIEVNESSNTITVYVSSKEVYERLNELSNNPVNLTSVMEHDVNQNIYNYDNDQLQFLKDVKQVNDMIPQNKKYILDHETSDGKTHLYEYDFNGFDRAKDLYYEKHIVLNGNKKRHFLRNNNDKPYFYDEYMNSEITYVDANTNLVDPLNPNNVKRKIYNKIIDENNVVVVDENGENNIVVVDENVENNIVVVDENVENNIVVVDENVENNIVVVDENGENNIVVVDENVETEVEVLINNNGEKEIVNEYNDNELVNDYINNIPDENKNNYLNYFIIFLILVCVLVILFIIFNYVFKSQQKIINN